MKKKIEKYLRDKNPNGPIRDERGVFIIGDDIEGCLQATQQSTFPQKQSKSSAVHRVDQTPHSFASQHLAPYATPMNPYSSKRSFDAMAGAMYSGIRYSSKRNCSESPRPTKGDLEALHRFFQTLRGGYVDGIYQSALERRRLAERTASDGSTDALINLNLTPEERDRLPRFFRIKTSETIHIRQHETSRTDTLPYGYMQWSRPSPMGDFMSRPLFGHTSLKPSPLSRTKDVETLDKSPSNLPSASVETPGPKKSERDDHHLSPLAPTPLQRVNDVVFTPNLFYGAADWGTPSWGGDDARILQDVLSSSRASGTRSMAITPRITRPRGHHFSESESGSLSRMTTPRVFFKDQLTESCNLDTNHSHIAVCSFECFPKCCSFINLLLTVLVNHVQGTPIIGKNTTPSKRASGVVTGSGPERCRISVAPLEERGKFHRSRLSHDVVSIFLRFSILAIDILLSTAILATPKSPKYGKNEMDQSLHHIEACIKSPLDFGSPTMK